MLGMNKLTSNPTSLDKLKTVFLLGLTCNLTTFAGCSLIWIILVKNDWISGFWETLFTVMAFAPIFMGDAINNYTLGRIRIEQQNGWDDVQISVSGREKVARYYKQYRLLSILPAYLLAAAVAAKFGADQATIQLLKTAFFAAFVINFLRATHFLQCFIAPRLPGYGGRTLVIRSFLTAAVFSSWFVYFWFHGPLPMSKLAIFGSGMLYFFINAVLNPLPTRFSLLRPGKPHSKAAFFTIEILNDEQLHAIPGTEKIDPQSIKSLGENGLAFLGNLRMPLIELPLFQAWGSAMVSADGKTLLLLLASEVKKGLHHTLVSVCGNKYVITTDFGAGQAKLPAEVMYKPCEKGTSVKDLLACHNSMIDDNFEQIAPQAWPRLESLVKSVIRFLENETTQRRQAQATAASINTNPAVEKHDN